MKDEYNKIYNYDIKGDTKFEDLDFDDSDEVIERLRNTIGRGDCLYCNSHLTMEYDGTICFICSKCGRSVHEDVYYKWASGQDIEFED